MWICHLPGRLKIQKLLIHVVGLSWVLKNFDVSRRSQGGTCNRGASPRVEHVASRSRDSKQPVDGCYDLRRV